MDWPGLVREMMMMMMPADACCGDGTGTGRCVSRFSFFFYELNCLPEPNLSIRQLRCVFLWRRKWNAGHPRKGGNG